ncbi:MAG: glycosyltransferase family 39 protein [Acidimicrobiales bacterium]|nr:glycosyltransferase family 39 protein [Acidimicrobiales bacterium]
MTDRHWRPGMVVILLIAAAVRLSYVVFVVGDDLAAGDAIYYSAQADTIAAGGGFSHPFEDEPAADHPPMTALLLAPVSVGAGDPLFEQRLLMAAIGTLAVGAIALLGREIGGRRGGLIAGGIAAVYPGLWINDGLAMSETPTALLTALVLLVAIRWRRDQAPGWLLGILGGLLVLTRAELGLLMAALVLPWGLSGAWLDRVRRIALVALVAVLVVAPWTVRNLIRFEEPVAVSTNDGLTLVGANCDPSYFDAVGFWYLQCGLPEPAGDQSEVSAAYREQALEYVGDHLDRVPTVAAARAARVWSVWETDAMTYLNRGEGRPQPASVMALYGWWLLAPAAAASLWSIHRRRGPLLVLVAPFVTVTIVAVLTYGIPRFRLPAEVAAIGALAVLGRIRVRHRHSSNDEVSGDEEVGGVAIGTTTGDWS